MWCLLLTFPRFFRLVVACFLPGLPVVESLTHMVTTAPGQAGGFSQCVSPHTSA